MKIKLFAGKRTEPYNLTDSHTKSATHEKENGLRFTCV